MGALTVTPQRVLGELAAIGLANADRYMQVEGGQLILTDWSELTKAEKAAVASVEKTSTGLRLKLYDKMKALELLGKMLGMFEDIGVKVEENNLLEAILQATGEEMDLDDLPEAQQAPAAGYELVEPAGTV